MLRLYSRNGFDHIVDTHLTLNRARERCPGFFHRPGPVERKNERYETYLGFLITNFNFKVSSGEYVSSCSVYVYDIEKDSLYYVNHYPNTGEAKIEIRSLLTGIFDLEPIPEMIQDVSECA